MAAATAALCLYIYDVLILLYCGAFWLAHLIRSTKYPINLPCPTGTGGKMSQTSSLQLYLWPEEPPFENISHTFTTVQLLGHFLNSQVKLWYSNRHHRSQ